MQPRSSKKQAGDYIIYPHNKLGVGTYGFVCEATKKSNPSKNFAAKTINLLILTENDENKKKRFTEILEREISILKVIKHKNIVEFIDAVLTKHNLYILFEKCSDGDLFNYQKCFKFQEVDILKFLKDILQGYSVLVANNIIHRDMKPKNILINNGNFKISDFGFSRFVEDCKETQLLTKSVGSPYYMAPEVYENGVYSNQCDIWSLGIILYELAFENRPWSGKNFIELFENIKSKPLEFPNIKNELWSEDFIDLMKKMLELDCEKRLTWEKLLNHKIVKSFGI